MSARPMGPMSLPTHPEGPDFVLEAVAEVVFTMVMWLVVEGI